MAILALARLLSMLIDQFNTTLSGGAAVAARRLHHALLDSGISSRFCYLAPNGQVKTEDTSYQPMNPRWKRSRNLLKWSKSRLRKMQLKRALKGRPAGLEMFSSPQVYPVTSYEEIDPKSDVIHLHWVAKLIDYTSFFTSVPDEFPIVWTLHDMNPFTGGCHYAGDCMQFEKECSHCPQLGTPGIQDLSWNFFHEKREALADKNLHIVSPSHWLETVARQSTIFRNARSFRTIHNGLDTNIFHPHDKKYSRSKLGLNSDKIIIGFGAESLKNYRKGFQHLLRAFSNLKTKDNVAALTFGNGNLEDIDIEVISTGFVRDPHKQSLIYSAADLFVMPSLEDNLPQTGIEAMACGTPVVAFASGGVPEYVHHGETGLLARTGNTAELTAQIDWLVAHQSERRLMGKNSRKFVIEHFDHHKQAAKYVRVYRELLSDKQKLTHQAA